jgi:sigma-B regulation protein RsbU (phosphoserine phosphatase)
LDPSQPLRALVEGAPAAAYNVIDFQWVVSERSHVSAQCSSMKLSLRTKLVAVLVVAPVLLLLVAIGVIWTLDYRQRVAEQGGMFRSESIQVGRSLRLAVERSIGTLNDLLSLGGVAALLESEEDPRLDLSSEAWKLRVQQIDSVWPSLRLDSPQVQTVLNNQLAARLRDFGRKNWIFAEIIVAGRAGKSVAATSRPLNYDQSKEKWWREGMRLSRGQAFLEGFHYDESAGVLALDIALPVVPEASGSAIGVLKAVVNVSTLLGSVTVLSIADAQAEVIGKDGTVLLKLSDKSFVPTGEKISQEAVSHLRPDPPGWFIAPLKGDTASMVGFSAFHILGQLGLDQQIYGDPLYVIVHSPASDILAPLRQRAAVLAVAGTAIILACLGLVVSLAEKMILAPLKTLSRAAEAMAATVISSRKIARRGREILDPKTALAGVDAIKTGDEMEAFAQDFSAMSGKLLRYQEDLKTELAAKTAEIQRDLDMARDFQQAFLPRDYPRVPTHLDEGRFTLSFHHIYRAAMSVSGDFFDVIKLNDDCAGVLIADVMGHGTRSALVTAILRTLLHGLAKAGEDPGLFLSLLNHHFHETMKRTDQLIFVSACFLVFDTRQATVRCASAGHPSPLMANRRTGEVQPVYKDLKKNPALGLLPEATYQVFSRELREHDIYLLFTDGVEEAMNEHDEYYGMERLQRAMTDNLKLDIGDLTEAIVDDILKFSGNQPLADDLCLVAAEAMLNEPARPASLQQTVGNRSAGGS